MYYLTSHIIPSLQIIKILGDTDKFVSWMKEIHPDKNPEKIFDGYKFSIECCLHSFFDGISHDQILEIKNDFLLDCALAEIIPLHHISDTCEKTIFLKNLKPHVKSVLRTRSYKGLKIKCKDFDNNISTRFAHIRKNNLSFSNDLNIDIETANQLCLIDYTHTFLIQINNNGPTALMLNPLNTKWITKKRLKHCFEGYKYAIQFLWNELLGTDKFNETHLVNLHLSDSWRDMKYIQKEDSFGGIFNREFRLEEQSSFSSYFYWIKNEVTDPLSKKHGFEVFTVDNHFRFNSYNYNKKKLFGDLLDPKKIKLNSQSMSLEDKIHERLYWYPFEIINTWESQMHLGIPAFNTMLAGTVALHKPKESEFPKVIVTKFIHPHSSKDEKNKKHDYSYGILVDTMSSAGHFSSGWIIYQNACGDYSGFSGAEFKTTEQLISKFSKEDKIELRELSIPLKKFVEFTNQFNKGNKTLSILESNELIPKIIQKAKSDLFEYFTYYVFSNAVEYKDFEVKLNVDRNLKEGDLNNGEKDIVIESKNEVIIIECKLNPQNHNIKKVINDTWKKANKYEQRQKSCQLWCWFDLSIQNKRTLESSMNTKTPVTYVEVNSINKNPILRGVSLKDLKFVMQNYESYDSFEENYDFFEKNVFKE